MLVGADGALNLAALVELPADAGERRKLAVAIRSAPRSSAAPPREQAGGHGALDDGPDTGNRRIVPA
jgi:hypothetical protein